MLLLFVTNGLDKGRLIRWAGGERITIGREPEASLQMHDEKISRVHVEIVHSRGRWFIRDLDSTNGTYVNLVRIDKAVRLQDGDQIVIGRTVISCCTLKDGAVPLGPTGGQVLPVNTEAKSADVLEEPLPAAPVDAHPDTTQDFENNTLTSKIPTASQDMDAEEGDTDWLAAMDDVPAWEGEEAESADDESSDMTDAGPPLDGGEAPLEPQSGAKDRSASPVATAKQSDLPAGDDLQPAGQKTPSEPAEVDEGPEDVFDGWGEAIASAIERAAEDPFDDIDEARISELEATQSGD